MCSTQKAGDAAAAAKVIIQFGTMLDTHMVNLYAMIGLRGITDIVLYYIIVTGVHLTLQWSFMKVVTY